MVPSARISSATDAERKKAVQDRLASSHNPSDGFNLARGVSNYLDISNAQVKEAIRIINEFEMDEEI